MNPDYDVTVTPISLSYRIKRTGWANTIHFHGEGWARRAALAFYAASLPRATGEQPNGCDLQILRDETGVFDQLRVYYSDPIEVPQRPAEDGMVEISQRQLGMETAVLVRLPLMGWLVPSPYTGEIDAFEARWQAEKWLGILRDLPAKVKS